MSECEFEVEQPAVYHEVVTCIIVGGIYAFIYYTFEMEKEQFWSNATPMKPY